MKDRPGPSITPGPGVRAISVSDGSLTGTVVLEAGANITIGTDAGNKVTIAGGAGGGGGGSFSAGVSTGGNTSGTTGTVSGRIVFVGGNNVTLSQSAGGANATVTISGPNTAAQTGTQFSAGISGGNTAGDTGTVAGRVVFAGGNNVTLSGSTNGVSETITISGPNTAAQTGTQFSAGLSNIGNTAGDTGVKAARLVLAGGNRVTVSGSTNGESVTVTISGAADGAGSVSTATTASSVTSANVVGADAGRYALEGHQHAGVGPAGVSNIGNTAGNTTVMHGRVVLAGGNNITLSVSSSNNNNQTITISAGAGGAETQTAISGISATDTVYTSGTVSFEGRGAATIGSDIGGGADQVVFVNVPAQTGTQFSGGISNLGNTAGDTGTKAGRLVLVGSDNITLSGSTNGVSETVSIIGESGGGGGGGATMSWFKQWPHQPGLTMTRHPQHTMVICPMTIPFHLTAHTARLWMSGTGATGSTAAFSWSVNVYTKNSNSLSLATSASSTVSWTSNSVAAGDWGGILGMRMWDITNQTFNFTPGEYFVATWGKSVNAGTLSYAAGSGIGASYSGKQGAVSNTSIQMLPGMGQYSATFSSAAPGAIALSDIDANMSGANQRSPDFAFVHSGWISA